MEGILEHTQRERLHERGPRVWSCKMARNRGKKKVLGIPANPCEKQRTVWAKEERKALRGQGGPGRNKRHLVVRYRIGGL